jgi:hypothetical protein
MAKINRASLPQGKEQNMNILPAREKVYIPSYNTPHTEGWLMSMSRTFALRILTLPFAGSHV